MYFVTYTASGGEKQCLPFFSLDDGKASVFHWLQEFWNTTGTMPKALSIYKAVVVFDGS